MLCGAIFLKRKYLIGLVVLIVLLFTGGAWLYISNIKGSVKSETTKQVSSLNKLRDKLNTVT